MPPHATTWADAAIPPSNNTVRGYTGHEQLDLVGLIHMNGRVYDPTLGRFTSADPIIQIPDNPQAYNRYSYVLNNPLSFTDPTGFFLDDLFDALGDFVEGIVDFISDVIDFVVDNIRTIAAIAVAATGNYWATYLFQGITATQTAFLAGFSSGLISSDGDLGDSFIAGATAVGFSQVGDAFANAKGRYKFWHIRLG